MRPPSARPPLPCVPVHVVVVGAVPVVVDAFEPAEEFLLLLPHAAATSASAIAMSTAALGLTLPTMGPPRGFPAGGTYRRAAPVMPHRGEVVSRAIASADGCMLLAGVARASTVLVRRMPGVASTRSSTSCRFSFVRAMI